MKQIFFEVEIYTRDIFPNKKPSNDKLLKDYYDMYFTLEIAEFLHLNNILPVFISCLIRDYNELLQIKTAINIGLQKPKITNLQFAKRLTVVFTIYLFLILLLFLLFYKIFG